MERKDKKSFNFIKAQKIIAGTTIGALFVGGMLTLVNPILGTVIMACAPLGLVVGGAVVAYEAKKIIKEEESIKPEEVKQVIEEIEAEEKKEVVKEKNQDKIKVDEIKNEEESSEEMGM